MALSPHLAPRDLRSTARSTAAFAAAGAVLLVVLTALVPTFGGTLVARLCALGLAAGLLALAVVVLRVPHRLPTWTWLAVPLTVVAATLALDLLTRDTSAAGQLVLTWPVLYAANELRRTAAVTVLVSVVAADAVIVLTLRPLGPALTDLAWLTTTAVIFVVLLVRSREREERLVAELTRQADVDPLTGLATRRVLDRATRRALETPAPGGHVLLLVDVDRFKAVNDGHGHPAGDRVLVHVAALLRQEVPAGGLVARLGGDELAVLLPGRRTDDAGGCAERFRRRLRQEPPRVQGSPLPVTVSMGIACSTGRTPDALYVAADEALYAAKRGGRDRVCLAPVPPQVRSLAPMTP